MTLKERQKKWLLLFLRFGLSLGLLAFLFSKIDVSKTIDVLKDADMIYIGYAFITFLIIHLFLLIRWGVFIRALDLQATPMEIVRYFFIGLFGNLFLPSAIGGDVIKTYGLCKNSSQKPKVVASVLLDRLSGFAGMTLVALVAFPFGYRLAKDMSLLTSIMLMLLGFTFLGVVLFTEKFFAFCSRLFNAFPRIKHGLMRVHYDAALLKDRRGAIYAGIMISALSQVFLSLTFYLVAKALHQDVPWIYFMIFVPMICVAATMPSIGGLGVREAGAVLFFKKVGMAAGIAVSVSLINFIFMVITGLLGAVFYFLTKPSAGIKEPALDPAAK